MGDVKGHMRADTIARETGRTWSLVDTNAFRGLYLSGRNRFEDFRQDSSDLFGKLFLRLLPFAGSDVVDSFRNLSVHDGHSLHYSYPSHKISELKGLRFVL